MAIVNGKREEIIVYATYSIRVFNVQLNVFINELIVFIIKKHDEGIEFDRMKQVVIQQINQITDDLLTSLSRNQNESRYIWFLGLFYHHGIGIDKDDNRAFEPF